MKDRKTAKAPIRSGSFIIILVMFLLPELLPPVIEAVPTRLAGAGAGWTQAIGSANLISGAGSDLSGSYQSATNTTTLNVTCGSSYRLWVRRADTLWDTADFTLNMIRTNDGTSGVGTITGPAIGVPVPVTTADSVFFSGNKSLSGITVQYQLTGVSVKTAPQNYSTLVTFTITSP